MANSWLHGVSRYDCYKSVAYTYAGVTPSFDQVGFAARGAGRYNLLLRQN